MYQSYGSYVDVAFSLLKEVCELAPVEPNPIADIVISDIEDSCVEPSLNIAGDVWDRASPKTI